MKSYSSAAIAALTDGTAIEVGAVKIACSPIVRIWSGYGPITLGGESYDGIGDRGLVQVSSGALGDSEQAMTLSLNGIEPDVLALFNASQVQNAAVLIWRLVFDGAGQNLLDSQIFARGRIDTLPQDEVVGGTASIIATVEGAARGLGRSGQRMRTDADQRLIDANDAGMRVVSFAGNKTLYWGGQKPSSASNLGWTPIPTAGTYGGYNGFGTVGNVF